MKTKETIAIIGATTKIGSLISKNLSLNDYRVLLTSKEAEKLISLKENILSLKPAADVYISECARNVSWEADIIILACTREFEEEIANNIEQVATGKVVISITVPLCGHTGKVSPTKTSYAEELQKRLPNARIVKAFYTTHPSDFVQEKSQIFIASNNGNTIQLAANVLTAAGFDPVVAGDLSVSRKMERMQMISSLKRVPGES